MKATRTFAARRDSRHGATTAPWLTPIGHSYAWPPEQHALHLPAAPSPWAKRSAGVES